MTWEEHAKNLQLIKTALFFEVNHLRVNVIALVTYGLVRMSNSYRLWLSEIQ